MSSITASVTSWTPSDSIAFLVALEILPAVGVEDSRSAAWKRWRWEPQVFWVLLRAGGRSRARFRARLAFSCMDRARARSA